MNGSLGDIHQLRRRIVSASKDKTLKIWDGETGAEVATLTGHSQWVNTCGYSADGRWILSASKDGTIKVWRADTGAEVGTFLAENDDLTVALGLGGRYLAAGDSSGTVYSLRLVGFEFGTPVVTPLRLWRFDHEGWLRRLAGLRSRGKWDAHRTVKCEWCGQRFVTTTKVLDVIRAITKTANLSAGESPCAKLPPEAWDDPLLLSECLLCHQPLRVNPFIVDNLDRY